MLNYLPQQRTLALHFVCCAALHFVLGGEQKQKKDILLKVSVNYKNEYQWSILENILRAAKRRHFR